MEARPISFKQLIQSETSLIRQYEALIEQSQRRIKNIEYLQKVYEQRDEEEDALDARTKQHLDRYFTRLMFDYGSLQKTAWHVRGNAKEIRKELRTRLGKPWNGDIMLVEEYFEKQWLPANQPSKKKKKKE